MGTNHRIFACRLHGRYHAVRADCLCRYSPGARLDFDDCSAVPRETRDRSRLCDTYRLCAHRSTTKEIQGIKLVVADRSHFGAISSILRPFYFAKRKILWKKEIKLVQLFDFAKANSNTLTIYGSDTPFTSATDANTGTAIGTLKANGTVTLSADYPYISIYASGAMYINSIEVEWEASKFATVSDLDALDAFINTYMHMDYTENLGYCADTEHHYYGDAKVAFKALSSDQRMYFANVEVNTQYADAYARLAAWAIANGETIDSDGNISSNSFDSIINNIQHFSY